MPSLTYTITNQSAVTQRLHDLRVMASYAAADLPPVTATLTDGTGAAHPLALTVQQDTSNGWNYLATLPFGAAAPFPVLLTVGAGETLTLTFDSADIDLGVLTDSSFEQNYPIAHIYTYPAQTAFLYPPTYLTPLTVAAADAPWLAQVTLPNGATFNTEGLSIVSSVGGGVGNHRELIPQLLTGFLTASEGMALTKVGGDVEWRPATGEKSAPFSAEVHLGEMAAANFVNLTIPLPSPLLLGTLVQILGTLPDDIIGVTFYADPQYGTVEYHGEARPENNWLDDVQGWRYRSTSKTLYARIVNYGTATSGDLTLRIEGEALA